MSAPGTRPAAARAAISRSNLTSPGTVVASGPAGRRAYNDIMTHYDHRTGQIRNITVWPELYGWGAGAESLKYRLQWTFPIMFSQHMPAPALRRQELRPLQSDDLGSSFEVISPDLTRNDPDKLKPSGGPVTRDNTGAEVYCTIFALAESPCQAGSVALGWLGRWAGSSLRRRRQNTGTNVTPPDLPEWALISIIDCHRTNMGARTSRRPRYKLDDTTPVSLQDDRQWPNLDDDHERHPGSGFHSSHP